MLACGEHHKEQTQPQYGLGYVGRSRLDVRGIIGSSRRNAGALLWNCIQLLSNTGSCHFAYCFGYRLFIIVETWTWVIVFCK